MGSPRRFLRFRETVLKHFSFLESRGLRASETSETYVRFAGEVADIEVFHGRQSFELGANVIRGGLKYSLTEFQMLRSSTNEDANFLVFAATDAHGVETGVGLLASALKDCIDAILLDSPDMYVELQSRREANRKKLAMDTLVSQTRPKADEAFRRGDYSRAAELYEVIREQLSPSEMRRLEIAKSRT